MSYVNWNEKYPELKSYHWCRALDLIDYLHEVTEFILTRTTEEDSSPNPPKLKYFDFPLINSATTRFPETEIVLCSEFGTWKTELDLLQLSITAMCNPSRLEMNYSDYKTEGEAEAYALKKVNVILHRVGVDCWEQEGFERNCNLLWEKSNKR